MAVAHPLWQEQVESAELPPGPVEPLGQAVHVDEPCIAAQNQAPAALAPLLLEGADRTQRFKRPGRAVGRSGVCTDLVVCVGVCRALATLRRTECGFVGARWAGTARDAVAFCEKALLTHTEVHGGCARAVLIVEVEQATARSHGGDITAKWDLQQVPSTANRLFTGRAPGLLLGQLLLVLAPPPQSIFANGV